MSQTPKTPKELHRDAGAASRWVPRPEGAVGRLASLRKKSKL